jgi:hypothetical protein
MKIKRGFAAVTCVVVAMGMGSFAGSAAAAGPPANDKIGGATDVTALPFSQTLDVTKATTDADDAQVNQSCGVPVTNNSVWYTFTAGAGDTVLVVDTTGSDYSSAVIIATGSPGSLTTQACGSVSSQVATTSGTTYYILVFDDSGSGGTLQLSVHGPGPKPPNDQITHATKVGSLPFSDTIDTTGATTGHVDTQANETCGAPATGNSVWYKFTAGPDDGDIFVDGSFSNYNVGFLVATGTPGALTTVTCGPFFVVATTTPGTTYYIMAFDFVGGGGGNLQLAIDRAPSVNVVTYFHTRVDSAGAVRLKGTYDCKNASSVEIFGSAAEIRGREVATGFFDDFLPTAKCDGAAHAWNATVFPDSILFGPGKSLLFTTSFACGDSVCFGLDETQVIKLAHGIQGPPTSALVKSRHVKVTPRAKRPYGTVGKSVPVNWGH